MPYTDSDPATASLTLKGVWIHDPLDPEATTRTYLYGRSTRSASIAPQQDGTFYAGRRYPIYDYGENQTDTLSLRMDVPHGSTWATDLTDLEAFAEGRRTYVVRDNRGRVLFASLGSYSESDQDAGTQVGMTATQVDYDQGDEVVI